MYYLQRPVTYVIINLQPTIGDPVGILHVFVDLIDNLQIVCIWKGTLTTCVHYVICRLHAQQYVPV